MRQFHCQSGGTLALLCSTAWLLQYFSTVQLLLNTHRAVCRVTRQSRTTWSFTILLQNSVLCHCCCFFISFLSGLYCMRTTCPQLFQACQGLQCSSSGMPDPFFSQPSSCVLTTPRINALEISSGNTKTFISSCAVTNSTFATAALSQLTGFQISGQGSCPCGAGPNPTQGYVVGIKLNARVSLSSAGLFAPDFTYTMRGCDATFTYRSTALTNGETFTVWVDLISSAAALRVSWPVMVACLVSLLVALF